MVQMSWTYRRGAPSTPVACTAPAPPTSALPRIARMATMPGPSSSLSARPGNGVRLQIPPVPQSAPRPFTSHKQIERLDRLGKPTQSMSVRYSTHGYTRFYMDGEKMLWGRMALFRDHMSYMWRGNGAVKPVGRI